MLNEVLRVGPCPSRIRVLIRRDSRKRSPLALYSPSLLPPPLQRPNKKAAVWEPG